MLTQADTCKQGGHRQTQSDTDRCMQTQKRLGPTQADNKIERDSGRPGRERETEENGRGDIKRRDKKRERETTESRRKKKIGKTQGRERAKVCGGECDVVGVTGMNQWVERERVEESKIGKTALSALFIYLFSSQRPGPRQVHMVAILSLQRTPLAVS